PVARIREVRLDFLLKLYFARQFGTAETRALMDAQITVCKGYLERLKARGSDLTPHSFEHLVHESKLTAGERTLLWLRRIATQVGPRKRSTGEKDQRPQKGRKLKKQ